MRVSHCRGLVGNTRSLEVVKSRQELPVFHLSIMKHSPFVFVIRIESKQVMKMEIRERPLLTPFITVKETEDLGKEVDDWQSIDVTSLYSHFVL